MDRLGNFVLVIGIVIAAAVACSPTAAQKSPAPPVTPTPAPAPSPLYINLTNLLTVAGPFDTFLNHLTQTNVIDTFQNQANNTDQGITIFAPTDGAFSSLKKPSLSNLTASQLKTLLLFHALPHYYSLAEFKDLSLKNPVGTFAGGGYSLNFSDSFGVVRIDSGWSNPTISSSVVSTDPVAVYEIKSVLLPTAIFGAAPPPAPPAPPPSSDAETTTTTTTAPSGGRSTAADSPSATPANSADQTRVIGFSVFCCIAGFLLLL